MNKLPQPIFQDDAAIEALANNSRVSSYPHLLTAITAIQQGYSQYRAASGNPFAVAHVPISNDVRNCLRNHYKNPPSDLKYITKMRAETEHLSCPMCGSMHSGTLDHVFPKHTYAEFSVLSLNLVPACKCNSKRKETLAGISAGERILHPYFDDCLGERLIGARIDKLGAVPRIGIKLVVPSTHPDYSAVSFHLRSVVERTAIRKYLCNKWSNLCRKPSLAVRALQKNPTDLAELRKILETELLLLDDQHGSKNNWDSVFVVGLLDFNVLKWLFRQLHATGRANDEPLLSLLPT